MNTMIEKTAQAAARETLDAVIEHAPAEVYRILAGATFETRALIAAWAKELRRLAENAEVQHEIQEHEDRDLFGRPLTPAERDQLNTAVRQHLSSRFRAK